MTAYFPSKPRLTFRTFIAGQLRHIADALRVLADRISGSSEANARQPMPKPFPFFGE